MEYKFYYLMRRVFLVSGWETKSFSMLDDSSEVIRNVCIGDAMKTNVKIDHRTF